MQLKYVFLFAFSLIYLQGFSQIAIGIKGGYTESWEYYGDVFLPPNAETHVSGFHISALGYYSFNPYFSLGAELGYVERGAACVPGWTTFEQDTKFYLNYIELPLFAWGTLPICKGKIELFGKAGYGISFIASAYREEIDLLNDSPPVKTKMELGENSILNQFDHGVYAGAGIGHNFGANQIFTAFDYYYGLRDAEVNNISKNRSFNISLGYKFSLN